MGLVASSVRNTKSFRIDSTLALAVAIVVLGVFLSLAAPGFLSAFNLINVLRQISLTSIMAIGFGVVVMTGGMDISMGNVAALVGMFCQLATDGPRIVIGNFQTSITWDEPMDRCPRPWFGAAVGVGSCTYPRSGVRAAKGYNG
jgi:ribose/xylose/arabinose/galactoside ABC-type transport system permease subunit